MSIDIKEWEAIQSNLLKCGNCGASFKPHEGLINYSQGFDISPRVCSFRCAELFTADFNAGEAERKCEP